MLLPAGEKYERSEDPEFGRVYEHALALLDQRREADALVPLRAAVEIGTDNVLAHERYQDAALAVGGEGAAAMRAFYAGMADRPGSPVPPYCRARLVEDDYSRLALYDECLRRDPSFYFAYLARARVHRELGRVDAALRDLELALAARPAHPESNLEMAGVLMDIGRFEEAEPYLSNYVGSRPADRVAAKTLAQLLLYRVGKVDAADRLLQRLQSEDAEDASVLMDLAAVAWRRGDYNASIAGYHRVLDLDRTRTRAALNLGNLYFELAQRERGEARDAQLHRARKAYRFFLEADRLEGVHDALDAKFTVPYRVDEIRAVIGADDAEPPAPGKNF
jgi:tetratricopeptide (TPR) repeat protein